jgi:hypothetical protein
MTKKPKPTAKEIEAALERGLWRKRATPAEKLATLQKPKRRTH